MAYWAARTTAIDYRRQAAKSFFRSTPNATGIWITGGLLPALLPQADGSVKALQPIASACVGCHTKTAAKRIWRR